MFDQQLVHHSEVYLQERSILLTPPLPPTPDSIKAPPSPRTDLIQSSNPHPTSQSILPSSILDTSPLGLATHVLTTEADALTYLAHYYSTSAPARTAFAQVLTLLTTCLTHDNSKLLWSGVGKSGSIARKLVSTLNSLRLPSTYLHPTEALHGDMGKILAHDVLILVTFSGTTSELLTLLPLISEETKIVVMSAHADPGLCEITRRRPDALLLPTPVLVAEKASFGVAAPSTSTTVALALGDALAITLAREVHGEEHMSRVFESCHPGGAIGAASGRNVAAAKKETAAEIMARVDDMASVETARPTGADILMAGYRSKNGWVQCGMFEWIPPSKVRMLRAEDLSKSVEEIEGLVRSGTGCVPDSMSTSDLGRMARRESEASEQGRWPHPDIVMVISATGTPIVVGVLMMEELLGL